MVAGTYDRQLGSLPLIRTRVGRPGFDSRSKGQ
jgi:hypothetical protein